MAPYGVFLLDVFLSTNITPVEPVLTSVDLHFCTFFSPLPFTSLLPRSIPLPFRYIALAIFEKKTKTNTPDCRHRRGSW